MQYANWQREPESKQGLATDELADYRLCGLAFSFPFSSHNFRNSPLKSCDTTRTLQRFVFSQQYVFEIIDKAQ